MKWNHASLGIGMIVLVAGSALGQVTRRISVSTAGTQGNSGSGSPWFSADARYMAFGSLATNFVAGDANGVGDIFVRDTVTGTTECLSLTPSGVTGNGPSGVPFISPDGRYVGYWSLATDLVAADTNGFEDIYLYDRATGTLELVSAGPSGSPGNGATGDFARMSSDGRFVAFTSEASDLVAGDANGRVDVFVRDRLAGTTELVSVDSSGGQADDDCQFPSISADGRFVAFHSRADNLVAGDTNGYEDIFIRDRQLGTTERVNLGPGGVQGDADSSCPVISLDGGFVAFESQALDLAPGAPSGWRNHLLLDRQTGVIEFIAKNRPYAFDWDTDLEVTPGGRFVAFTSWADDVIPGDTNGAPDVFIRDRQLGTVERVSVSSGGAQVQALTFDMCVSDDGRFVAFYSQAPNLVPMDTNGSGDVFQRDRMIGSAVTNFTSLCQPGIDAGIDCPCSNPPAAPGRGCDNSAATGGATLSASGNSELTADGLVFATSGEEPTALSILAQGNSLLAPGSVYGQGVRCVGGRLIRLFTGSASGGSIVVPDFSVGNVPVSVRSAQKGDVIQPGESRWYYVFYRDLIVLGGCPPDSTFNATQAGRIDWFL
jgi:Tol biopolymer transport system component